jgi:hypothetical protein
MLLNNFFCRFPLYAIVIDANAETHKC